MTLEEIFPLGPLQGQFYDNGRKIVLLRPFAFSDPGKRYIVVPAFQTSDFNSIPRGLWNFFPPWEHPEAGVVHDFLYRQGALTRADCDGIHKRILELTGASWFKRHTSYRALRLFGGIAWGKYRDQEQGATDRLAALGIRLCPRCGGKGKCYDYDTLGVVSCPDCYGTGEIHSA